MPSAVAAHGPSWIQLAVRNVSKALQSDSCVTRDLLIPGNNTETSGLFLFSSLSPIPPWKLLFLSLESKTPAPPSSLIFVNKEEE